MKANKFAILLLAALMGAASAWAQNSTLTPYSRFGYGILNDNATAAQRGMGGVGYAMNSGRQINVMNPASYAAIDSLTFLFDMGMNLKSLHSTEGSTSEDNFTAGLDYITMAFPLSKTMGASVGILPYSSTGYVFGESIQNGTVNRAGSGDITMLYAGVGWSPIRNASVGANFAYMFGTNVNDVYAYTISGSTSLFERYMRIRDWKLDIGVQYDININSQNRVTLGLTFSPGKSFHGETYGAYYDVNLDATPDTTGYTKLSGNFTMPSCWGAGISYTWRNRLLVEADFTYQPWSKAKYATIEEFETSEFADRYKIAAGAQYTPYPRGNYLQRTQYRVGAYYNHDYIMVKGNNVREFGLTCGLGLPIPSFKTIINLGFEYKHRQASPQALIKENYFCVNIGLNFNELWFHKRKL